MITPEYESEARVATYLEMEWSDWLLFSSPEEAQQSVGPPAGPVAPIFYSKVVEFARPYLASQNERVRMCDVGGSTGRLVFECLHQFPNIDEAVLVEPSPPFNDWSKRLLLESDSLPAIPTVGFHMKPGRCNARRRPPRVQAFSHAQVCLYRGYASAVPRPNEYFDFVTCLNVADRVEYPQSLVSDLKRLLKPEGVLILACPMDWRHNTETREENRFENLREILPTTSWQLLRESEIEYGCRNTNRQVLLFLSQVVAVRKLC